MYASRWPIVPFRSENAASFNRLGMQTFKPAFRLYRGAHVARTYFRHKFVVSQFQNSDVSPYLTANSGLDQPQTSIPTSQSPGLLSLHESHIGRSCLFERRVHLASSLDRNDLPWLVCSGKLQERLK